MRKRLKVPVIMQMEALECGAACVCMIAAYYKKWIPLTQVRSDGGVSRDGSVAKNMLNAARSYGFDSSGYKVDPEMLGELTLPLIIHWNFNHFVVLCGIDTKRGKFYLNDPARGKVTVTAEEFDRSFTGIAITMTPGKEFHPEGKQKSVFTFAKRCLKGAFWPFVLAVIVSIVGDIIAISSPISQRIFTDNLLAGKNTAWLYPFLGILGVILLIQILVGIIRSIYWLKIEGKFAVTSSSNFMWHVLRLPLEFFSQRNVADVVSRQESTSNIALTLIQKIAPMFSGIISMFAYLFIMIKYSWLLTIIGIIATIIDMFLAK